MCRKNNYNFIVVTSMLLLRGTVLNEVTYAFPDYDLPIVTKERDSNIGRDTYDFSDNNEQTNESQFPVSYYGINDNGEDFSEIDNENSIARFLPQEENEKKSNWHLPYFISNVEWQHLPLLEKQALIDRIIREWNNPINWRSNPFLLKKKNPNFFERNSDLKSVNDYLLYNWGPNPTFWGSTPQLKQTNENLVLSKPKPQYFHPSYVRSGWESNPNFWGKRDFWTSRGKKSDKQNIILKLLGKNNEVTPSFWKSRGKREKVTNKFSTKDENSKLKGEMSSFLPPDDIPIEPRYWFNRGKKNEEEDKENAIQLEGERPVKRLIEKPQFEDQFWTSRGRKRPEDSKFLESKAFDKDVPYWTARGKKVIGTGSISVRGDSKDFWINRGRKSLWNMSEQSDLDNRNLNVFRYLLEDALAKYRTQMQRQGSKLYKEAYRGKKGIDEVFKEITGNKNGFTTSRG